MAKNEARLELERAYRILVDCQDANDQERQLNAAMHVIVAWEAISEKVTAMALEAMDTKGLTQPE